MENKKEKGEEREKRERERFAPALIAATTAGPVGHAQRSRARADEATGKGGRGLEIRRLEQRKIPRIRGQGFRRILSSMMKSFLEKNILVRDLILIYFRDVVGPTFHPSFSPSK